jgi:hypothetical protein
MQLFAIISAALAVLALVGLAVAYGKYRAQARLAASWAALAKSKELYANTLKTELGAKEEALRASEKARLARMPASELADVFRGMYGPKRTPGK